MGMFNYFSMLWWCYEAELERDVAATFTACSPTSLVGCNGRYLIKSLESPFRLNPPLATT